MPKIISWFDDSNLDESSIREIIDHIKYIKYWRNPCKKCIVQACCTEICKEKIYHFRFDHYVIDNTRAMIVWFIKLLFGIGVAFVIAMMIILVLGSLLII